MLRHKALAESPYTIDHLSAGTFYICSRASGKPNRRWMLRTCLGWTGTYSPAFHNCSLVFVRIFEHGRINDYVGANLVLMFDLLNKKRHRVDWKGGAD